MAIPSLSEIRLGRCCCFDLRLGSLIIAGINMVCYLIIFVATIAKFSFLSEKIFPLASNFTESGLTSLIVLFVILLGLCALLIHGILSQTSSYMFPWMCVNFTFLLFTIASSIGSILYEIIVLSLGGILLSALGAIIAIGIQGYAYLVLFSVYCEALEGSSGSIRGV